MRIVLADDYLTCGTEPQILAGVEKIAQALGVTCTIRIPEAQRPRAAPYQAAKLLRVAAYLESLRIPNAQPV
ncbi:MAG: hypothetical protein ACUVRV_05885 [Cyanobacteriota bacterium]